MTSPDMAPPVIYYDSKFDTMAHKIGQGEYCVLEKTPDMIVTSLGSCVAVCLRDPVTGVGGMNHFILPEETRGTPDVHSNSLCYGTYAMEALIRGIIRQGGVRARLEMKAFGGASVMNMEIGIGASNCRFVTDFAVAEGFRLRATDFAGLHPRRVHYFPATGKAFVQRLSRLDDQKFFRGGKTLLSQEGLAARADRIEQLIGDKYEQD